MQNSGGPSLATDTARSRRGRPRAFDRDLALSKAVRLFWERGFEATSIADLTEALGIGSPSLYAAFGSKEALFCEALERYALDNEAYVWAKFRAASTARDAVDALLSNSATALTGSVADIPRGCMVVLSRIDGEGHEALAERVRDARGQIFDRLLARLEEGVLAGEIPPAVDRPALARFIQTTQAGMSILARDGATGAELQDVADIAMAGWDARIAAAATG